jgi:hypothetical protein
VTPQRTIDKANENHTDEMTKHRSEHFTVLVSPTHRTDLAPCYFHLFLQLKKTSDRAYQIMRSKQPNTKCSYVVVDLQNRPHVDGVVCSAESHSCFSEVSIPNMEKKKEGITFWNIFILVKF